MNDTIKGALLIAGAVLIVGLAQIYFSPYQSCTRAGFHPLHCIGWRR
jgi:hypothetical protein